MAGSFSYSVLLIVLPLVAVPHLCSSSVCGFGSRRKQSAGAVQFVAEHFHRIEKVVVRSVGIELFHRTVVLFPVAVVIVEQAAAVFCHYRPVAFVYQVVAHTAPVYLAVGIERIDIVGVKVHFLYFGIQIIRLVDVALDSINLHHAEVCGKIRVSSIAFHGVYRFVLHHVLVVQVIDVGDVFVGSHYVNVAVVIHHHQFLCHTVPRYVLHVGVVQAVYFVESRYRPVACAIHVESVGGSYKQVTASCRHYLLHFLVGIVCLPCAYGRIGTYRCCRLQRKCKYQACCLVHVFCFLGSSVVQLFFIITAVVCCFF